MGAVLPYTLLGIGFVFPVKGADLLVDGASSIARRLQISDLVIGLTVVAFGTSTPELFVNIIAGLKGNTDIAVGNVLGSNISNILLILGVSSMIYPLPFHPESNVDIGVVVLAGLFLFISMFTGKRRRLERWEGAFLCQYMFFMFFFL